MASVFLGKNEQYTLATAATVFGNSGQEKVAILPNVVGQIVLDQNIKTLEFSAPLSAFNYQQVGNQLKIFSSADASLSLQFTLPEQGAELIFSNGSVQAVFTATTLLLGGVAVAENVAQTLIPTEIDTSAITTSGAIFSLAKTVNMEATLTVLGVDLMGLAGLDGV